MHVADRFTEREAKFEVDRQYDPPDLRGLIGRTERLAEKQLRTLYFDTRDRRLAEPGIALRFRSDRDATAGGDQADGTWALKIPEAGRDAMLHRDELSWAGDSATIPGEALDILRGVVRRSKLELQVELDTTRRRLSLYSPGGDSVCAELDDDLVQVVGGPNDGMVFRQIEVEAASGATDTGATELVLDCLRRSGAKPVQRSKVSIAMGERQGGGPGGKKGKRRRRETLEETIAAGIRADLQRLLAHDYRLRAAAPDPDAEDIHQARVAARRLRSNIKTFARVLDPVWVSHIRDDLSWIGSVLGAVRDLDVRAKNFASQAPEVGVAGPHLSSLVRELDAEREQPVADVADALKSGRYINLLDRLDTATHSLPVLTGAALAGEDHGIGPDSPARRALPRFIDVRWKALRRKVRKAGSHPDDEALHKIRIRAKQLRYAAETAAPVVGKPARRTAARAEAIQTVLGDLHDTVTNEAWLRDRASASTPAQAFEAGLLCHEQLDRRERLRREWRSEWARLDRRKVLDWLSG